MAKDSKWSYRAGMVLQVKIDIIDLLKGFEKPERLLHEWMLLLDRIRDGYPDMEEPIVLFLRYYVDALKAFYNADAAFNRMLRGELEKRKGSDAWYEPWCTRLRNEVELTEDRQAKADITIRTLNAFMEYVHVGDKLLAEELLEDLLDDKD